MTPSCASSGMAPPRESPERPSIGSGPSACASVSSGPSACSRSTRASPTPPRSSRNPGRRAVGGAARRERSARRPADPVFLHGRTGHGPDPERRRGPAARRVGPLGRPDERDARRPPTGRGRVCRNRAGFVSRAGPVCRAAPRCPMQLPPRRVIYERPALLVDRSSHFCPGCGHGIIHRLVAGCSGLDVAERSALRRSAAASSPTTISPWTSSSRRRRAPPRSRPASGARGQAFVFTYQGDGDLAAIGTAGSSMPRPAASGSASSSSTTASMA